MKLYVGILVLGVVLIVFGIENRNWMDKASLILGFWNASVGVHGIVKHRRKGGKR
jgi:hypothetical protein